MPNGNLAGGERKSAKLLSVSKRKYSTNHCWLHKAVEFGFRFKYMPKPFIFSVNQWMPDSFFRIKLKHPRNPLSTFNIQGGMP
jgi:hypothetical protein